MLWANKQPLLTRSHFYALCSTDPLVPPTPDPWSSSSPFLSLTFPAWRPEKESVGEGDEKGEKGGEGSEEGVVVEEAVEGNVEGDVEGGEVEEGCEEAEVMVEEECVERECSVEGSSPPPEHACGSSNHDSLDVEKLGKLTLPQPRGSHPRLCCPTHQPPTMYCSTIAPSPAPAAAADACSSLFPVWLCVTGPVSSPAFLS